jgi:hypothetical protein
LRREKEQLDISDSNAMLLHPNQFSIGHPASPGGPQAPRKTRRTGHKFGAEAEEAAAAAEKSRKRKLFDENEIDSPGPSGRNVEIGNASPFREAKARTMHTQFEAAAYSLDRLFTEKELNMAMTNATNAASHFFAKMKTNEPTNADTATNGHAQTNGDHASENGELPDADQDSDEAALGATDMVRQVSSNPHATRGATRSTTTITNGQIPFIYNPPFVLDQKIFQKVNASAPTPPPLAPQDVDQDLKLMLREARPDDELNERLLQAACQPVKMRDYQVQPPGFTEPPNEITSHVRTLVPHLEVGSMGGVPMSAQSSMAGYSDAGGYTPLGRSGEASTGHGGGIPMARTASGRGRGRGRGQG